MRLVQSALIALAVGAAVTSLTPVATAVTADPPDQVVAFTHEFTRLDVWEDPHGCVQLPVGTHLIFNQTDKPITIYYDPACLLAIEPFSRVKPNYGTHVSAVGSFRA